MHYCLTPHEWMTHPIISEGVVRYVSLRSTLGYEMTLGIENKRLPHTSNLKRRSEVGARNYKNESDDDKNISLLLGSRPHLLLLKQKQQQQQQAWIGLGSIS